MYGWSLTAPPPFFLHCQVMRVSMLAPLSFHLYILFLTTCCGPHLSAGHDLLQAKNLTLCLFHSKKIGVWFCNSNLTDLANSIDMINLIQKKRINYNLVS